MGTSFRFNRLEFAGSLGDLGTLLPLALGMIFINGLSPSGIFLVIGLFYILSGLYFRVTVPVQPMKVIGAYAIATAIRAQQIQASSFLMGIILLILGITGIITIIGRFIPRSVVRGVQLSTGILLTAQGVKLIIGSSKFQIIQNLREPFLGYQNLGPIPVGLVIATIAFFSALLLMENRKFPGGLILVLGGIFIGLLFGTHKGLKDLNLGFKLPGFFPYGFSSLNDISFAFVVLVLPQIPMTLGNAVVAYVDLSKHYFGSESKRVTYRSSCISMAVANLLSTLFGGIPLCHGAGGLSAHYRFGARSAGSNIIIGSIFLVLSLSLGKEILSIIYLIPLSVLGVLLIFAGCELALTIIDIKTRKDLFIPLLMLGITLSTNLAVGFITGIIIAHVLKLETLNI